MFNASEDDETEANLLLHLATRGAINQSLPPDSLLGHANAQPSAAAVMPLPLSWQRSGANESTHSYNLPQSHSAPTPQYFPPDAAVRGPENNGLIHFQPEQGIQLLVEPSATTQWPISDQDRPSIADARSSITNNLALQPQSTTGQQTQLMPPLSLADSQTLCPQSSWGSNLLPNGSKRSSSHSASAIPAPDANATAAIQAYDPSVIFASPMGEAMAHPSNSLQMAPIRQRTQLDSYNTAPLDDHHANLLHPGHIAPMNSTKAASDARVPSRARRLPILPPSKEKTPQLPPDKDSWVHNIDTSHPSSEILTSAPSTQAVPPDTKTKQSPIGEEDLTHYDILSGRGGKTNLHSGNRMFRRLVLKYKQNYLCAKKTAKRQLVTNIVQFVRRGQGRFLQKEGDGFWYEIGDNRAISKLAQNLREGSSASSICREAVANAKNNPETEAV